jgi:hypothetical protein
MANMFTNYDNDIKSTPCFMPPPFEPKKGTKLIKNVKGETIGVQADRANDLQLYFHLEDVCEVEIEEIMPGTTIFEVLTTTHKSIFSKEYTTAEILDQFTGDLYIFLTVDEMKNFKKETYTMKVTLKTADTAYEVFAENDGYLIIR